MEPGQRVNIAEVLLLQQIQPEIRTIIKRPQALEVGILLGIQMGILPEDGMSQMVGITEVLVHKDIMFQQEEPLTIQLNGENSIQL